MTVRILQGDCREVLRTLPDQSVHCIVTSPPYFGLRDYDVDGQMGLEETPEAFVVGMVAVFAECRRVLREDGVLFLNIGDSYSGGGRGGNPGSSEHQKQRTNAGSISVRHVKRSPFKDKDLIGIPWALAFALRADGWYLRSEIIWAKPNGMPGSQQDRCTSSHETVFMLSKSRCYWSDFDAIKTPPRESTLVRIAQDLQAQAGSHRANGGGKTNGPMKAVCGRSKQRGHSRTYAGFNDRWDAMKRSEQQSLQAMMRDVWFISPDCNKWAHFAMMPRELARRCILAGCPAGGVVLDPFAGAGTTGLVADRLQRDAVLIELNPAYVEISRKRIAGDSPLFAEVA
jgi:DNA modification methylase